MVLKGSDGGAAQGGGTATARVPTTEDSVELARRADVEDAATRYLKRTGNEDLLPILGLDPDQPSGGVRRCGRATCNEVIVSVKLKARYCSMACAASAASDSRRRKTPTAT